MKLGFGDCGRVVGLARDLHIDVVVFGFFLRIFNYDISTFSVALLFPSLDYI